MVPLRYPYLWLIGGLLVMGLILAISVAPAGGLLAIQIVSDKTSHFLAFCSLMLWFSGVFEARNAIWVGLGLLAFGVLIEVVQSLLPYRMAETRDVLADALGIVAGWALAHAGLRGWTRWVEAWLPGRIPP